MNENSFALAYKKRSMMPLFVLFDFFLEARAEIQKSFRSFFGENENFKKSF
jgi:hypothetical protein